MSNSLVRKSLDLINFETDLKQDKKRKKKKAKNIIDLIPVNHRIIKKKNKNSDSSVVLQHSRKITIHEVKKQLMQKKDPTEDNIKKLLLLSNNKIKLDTAKKLFERGVKKRPILQEEKPEEEKTAFTEEDFLNFEKEYLGE